MENSNRNVIIIFFLILIFSFFGKQIFSSTIEYQSGKSCSKGRDLSNVVVAGGSITETIYYLDHQSKISANLMLYLAFYRYFGQICLYKNGFCAVEKPI